MKLWTKILLWLFVAVVPGGSIVLPILLGEALIKRRRAQPLKDEPTFEVTLHQPSDLHYEERDTLRITRLGPPAIASSSS